MAVSVGRSPPTWLRILLSVLGAVAGVALALGACRVAGLAESLPPINPVSFLAVALLAVALDWLFFDRMFGFASLFVAHGEEEPRYRDYIGLRLTIVAAGALLGFVASRWQPSNTILGWTGGSMLVGGHFYVWVAVFRDLINPPDRRV